MCYCMLLIFTYCILLLLSSDVLGVPRGSTQCYDDLRISMMCHASTIKIHQAPSQDFTCMTVRKPQSVTKYCIDLHSTS